LLFEDILHSRLNDLNPHLIAPHNTPEPIPLHRMTVFATYACNLSCEYCKTIHLDPDSRAEPFSLDTFSLWLDSMGETPIRHIHFTGGEAGLVRGLPQMLRLARQRGVTFLSMTTNGTLPAETYRDLVESGLDETRVSVDARDPQTGELLTGRKQAWDRSVATIRFLVSLRDAGAPLFVIANTVVSERNRRDIDEIVQFLLGLGVDDLKLITVVQQKQHLGNFPEAEFVTRRIREDLARYPDTALPLLRRKLETIFDPEAIGLAQVPPEPKWRCYIPLSERTVDSQYYYPCSVYRREGGAPLGQIGEPLEVQQRKTAEFVSKGDCLNDPICREYCLHCTRNFNIAANAMAQKEPANACPV
jgi:MoaA/NifB/PqqE/SkfB family radical SAM enzyme